MAKLPKAVQMQEDRANEILEKMKNQMQSPPAEPSHSEVDEPDEPIEEVADVEEVEEIAEPVLEDPKPPKKEEDRENDPKYWKHRLQTAQGIFDAEKNRLKEQLSNQTSELDELRKSVKELQKATAKKVQLKDFLSEEEMEALGENNLDVIARIAEKKAEEAATSYIKDLIDEKITPVENKLKKTEQEFAEKQENLFWTAIEQNIPKWRETNSDPKFLSWLQARDVFGGGRTRLEVLQGAQSALDSETVIAIFKAFLATKKPEPTPRRKVPSPDDLPSGGIPPTRDDIAMTAAEVKAFYDRMAKGYYKNRPSEMEAMEKKINMAYAAGLIR